MVRKTQPLKWLRNGIGGTKKGDLDSIGRLSNEEKQYYEKGKDVIHLPGSTNVAAYLSPDDYKDKYTELFRGWGRQMGFSRASTAGMTRTLASVQFPSENRTSPNAQAHHQALTDRILKPTRGVIEAPEDKSPEESYMRTEEGHLYYLAKELE